MKIECNETILLLEDRYEKACIELESNDEKRAEILQRLESIRKEIMKLYSD